MLDAAVGIGELCANRTDIRTPRQRHHLAEPGAVERRGVVVEQADVFAARGLSTARLFIAEKLNGAGMAQHADAAADLLVFVLDRPQIIARIRVGAAVVDDDQLVILVFGLLAARSRRSASETSAGFLSER